MSVAIVVDALLVVAFAATGRASHDSDVLSGLAGTAWPFLTGLAVGWLMTRAWRAPLAPVRSGIPIWLWTLVIGMLLRAASGQGTALPFVLVAAGVLFALLVGWRAIVALVRTLRGRRAGTSPRARPQP